MKDNVYPIILKSNDKRECSSPTCLITLSKIKNIKKVLRIQYAENNILGYHKKKYLEYIFGKNLEGGPKKCEPFFNLEIHSLNNKFLRQLYGHRSSFKTKRDMEKYYQQYIRQKEDDSRTNELLVNNAVITYQQHLTVIKSYENNNKELLILFFCFLFMCALIYLIN
jgi:hypothetical protein